MDTPEQVRDLLIQHGLADKADALMALLRPSIRIFTQPADDETIPVGASKIGGEPDLPVGFVWPMWEHEPPDWFIENSVRYNDPLPEKIRPLGFLAQFNLSDITRYDVEHLLPSDGMLYFFYDGVEQPREEFTHDGGARVYCFKDANLKRTSAPSDLPSSSQFKWCRLTFETKWMLPAFYSPYIEVSRDGSYRDAHRVHLSESDKDAYYMMWRVWTRGTRHYLLGYPYPIQDSPEYLCEEKVTLREGEIWLPPDNYVRRWRLLLQLDSDGNAEMWWASGGTLYFCIPDETLAARRFEDGMLIMQFS